MNDALRNKLRNHFYLEKVKCVKNQDYEIAAKFRYLERFLMDSDDLEKLIEYIKELGLYEDDRISIDILKSHIRKVKLKKIEKL